jgi:hypothetical protein
MPTLSSAFIKEYAKEIIDIGKNEMDELGRNDFQFIY